MEFNNDRRKLLAWCEIAGLLHDVGKLSSIWLEYRRLWQEKDERKNSKWDYFNDPHCHEFLSKYDDELKKFSGSQLHKILMKGVSSINGSVGKDFQDVYNLTSIDKVINEHERVGYDPPTILSQLRLADSIDSACDRNNPLFCREQKTGLLYDTEVFGHEESGDLAEMQAVCTDGNRPDYAEVYLRGAPPGPHIVCGAELDSRRGRLYEYLNTDNRLGTYLEKPDSKLRREILGAIRTAFDCGLADTTRPNNDTTLWEHTYSVAALFKAAVLRCFATGTLYKELPDIRFRLLGIGWNGLAYMANVPRLSDTLGRQKTLFSLVDELRDKIEWDLMWGSLVYWDVNQAIFLTPDIEDIRENQVMDKIKPVFRKVTKCDLFPDVHVEQGCSSLTSIVKVTDALRKRRHVPVKSVDRDDIDNLKVESASNIELCTVCRRRVAEKFKRCGPCLKRQSDAAKDSKRNGAPVFLSEIASGNDRTKGSRIALILVNFGFRNWLSGRMHRTMMVTEAQGIKKEVEDLGNINYGNNEKAQKAEELDIKRKDFRKKSEINPPTTYAEILGDMKTLLDPAGDDDRIDATAFVYHRRNKKYDKKFHSNCESMIKQFSKEYGLSSVENPEALAAAMCTKTPTPSTLLDTWHAPYRFLRELSVSAGINGEKKWLDTVRRTIRQRVSCSFPEGAEKSISVDYPYQCRGPSGSRFDVVFQHDDNGIEIHGGYIIGGELKRNDSGKAHTVFEVDEGCEKKITGDVTVTLDKKEEYMPVREVLLSPALGMFLVPADHAFSAALRIKERYDREFGKVHGRLPFNIGLLYFQCKHPVYLVLDAARRMVEGFEAADSASPVTGEVVSDVSEKRKDWKGFNVRIGENGCVGREFPFEMEYTLGYDLGDGKTDCHHPYIMVEPNNGTEQRPSFFKTVAWEKEGGLYGMVHVSDVRKGDRIVFAPSGFDFELLDSIESRHAIAYWENRRRSMPFVFENKPYRFEEMSLFDTWRRRLKNIEHEGESFFKRSITDTELRSLESLWTGKMIEWEVDLAQPESVAFGQWKTLVETSLRDTFPAFRDETMKNNLDETLAAATNGLLLDAIQLFFHIQKEKVADGES